MSPSSDQRAGSSAVGAAAHAAPVSGLSAVVLAAGKGTRMNSDLPKVVHEAHGRPMVRWVVEACRAAGATPVVLVVGHRADDVRRVFAGDDTDLAWALQTEQRGTGHAVAQAEAPLMAAHRAGATDCLVLYGDGPLIRLATLLTLVERHRASGAAATLATAVIDDPTGYGRILRDSAGRFLAIREQKDASDAERAIREINPGYYCFGIAELFSALARVDSANASGEVYLTDVFEILLRDGRHIEVVAAVPPEDVLSVNTPEQLRTVSALLERRASKTAVSNSHSSASSTSPSRAGSVHP